MLHRKTTRSTTTIYLQRFSLIQLQKDQPKKLTTIAIQCWHLLSENRAKECAKMQRREKVLMLTAGAGSICYHHHIMRNFNRSKKIAKPWLLAMNTHPALVHVKPTSIYNLNHHSLERFYFQFSTNPAMRPKPCLEEAKTQCTEVLAMRKDVHQ